MSGFEDLVPAEFLTNFLSCITSLNDNKKCIDCGENYAPWASVNNGIFVCINCSGKHRSLGVGLSFVKSVSLDTSWTWKHVRTMQVGGNGSAKIAFSKAGLDKKSINEKYSHDVMVKYRMQLKKRAFKHHQMFKCELGKVQSESEPTIEEPVITMVEPVLSESVPMISAAPISLSTKQTKKKSKLGAMKLDLSKLENNDSASALSHVDEKNVNITTKSDEKVNDRLGFASKSYNFKPKSHAVEEIQVEYSAVEEQNGSSSTKYKYQNDNYIEFFGRNNIRDDGANYISVEPDPIMRSNISHELKKTHPKENIFFSQPNNNSSDDINRYNEYERQPAEAEIFEKFKNASAISSSDFHPQQRSAKIQTNRDPNLNNIVQTISTKLGQLKDFTFDKLSQYYDEYIDQ